MLRRGRRVLGRGKSAHVRRRLDARGPRARRRAFAAPALDGDGEPRAPPRAEREAVGPRVVGGRAVRRAVPGARARAARRGGGLGHQPVVGEGRGPERPGVQDYGRLLRARDLRGAERPADQERDRRAQRGRPARPGRQLPRHRLERDAPVGGVLALHSTAEQLLPKRRANPFRTESAGDDILERPARRRRGRAVDLRGAPGRGGDRSRDAAAVVVEDCRRG
mmetsp:Transcript_3571/g.10616  ORF Transcript_3571/g.10616 Transcript_3571/m.10616 type:complete len:222 (+) Transcript_3571:644-1309(+)